MLPYVVVYYWRPVMSLSSYEVGRVRSWKVVMKKEKERSYVTKTHMQSGPALLSLPTSDPR